MKTFCLAVTMLLVLVLALACFGCRGVAPVVTAKVRFQTGTNVVEITQPKDTTIGVLRWNGLEIQDYSSVGNAEAIAAARAQAEAHARVVGGLVDLVGGLAGAVARANGIPLARPVVAEPGPPAPLDINNSPRAVGSTNTTTRPPG